MQSIIIKLFGLTPLMFFGDPSSFDRFVWLKKHLHPGLFRTLDAGCGSGALTMYAAKIGNETLGISFDERNTKIAMKRAQILGMKNVKFIQHDLRFLSEIVNDIGLFDQIICFETIEHIMDDQKLIADFSQLLKTDGQLLLTAPYKYYKHLIGDKLSDKEDGGHVRWGYTHEEIRVIFSNNGLEIGLENYVSGFISQQICNLQRILSFVFGKLSWFIVFPLRVLQLIDNPITKLLGYPYLSIGVIGVKKK